MPLSSIPARERAEGYYWVKRGDVPEVAFWTLRRTWQFVWSERDWSDGDIEMLSDRLAPPGP